MHNIVFCSALRLCPVLVGNGRILDQDIVLSGYNVPAQVSPTIDNFKLLCNYKELFPQAIFDANWQRF